MLATPSPSSSSTTSWNPETKTRNPEPHELETRNPNNFEIRVPKTRILEVRNLRNQRDPKPNARNPKLRPRNPPPGATRARGDKRSFARGGDSGQHSACQLPPQRYRVSSSPALDRISLYSPLYGGVYRDSFEACCLPLPPSLSLSESPPILTHEPTNTVPSI